MRSERHAAIAAAIVAIIAGCAEDPALLVHVEGRAATIVVLEPTGISLSRQGRYRWDLADAPARSTRPQPTGEASGRFQPDVRGTYVVERWFTYGVGEDLTHRFVVDVSGAPPVAMSRTASLRIAVAQSAVIDGASSSSLEGLPLEYRWRLAHRPVGSVAVIATTGVQTTLEPDVPGAYKIELSVFDGELWSVEPAPLMITAE